MNREQIVALLTGAQAQKYIDQVASVFKTIPHLPKSLTDIVVQITSWLVVISGVLSAVHGIQYLLYAFGVSDISVIAGISPIYWLILGIQQLVVAYLSILAFQPLREQKYVGWVLLFWAMVSAAVAAIVTIIFIPGALLGSVIGLLIGFYLTFEIKNYYTAEGIVVSTPKAVEAMPMSPVLTPKTTATKTTKPKSKKK